jgi:FkbM family methyltransferase
MVGRVNTSLPRRTRLGAAQETVRFVLNHPLNRRARLAALLRFLGWQLWKRTVRQPLTVRLWDQVRLRAYPDSTSASLAIYTRLHQYDEMMFVLRYVRPGDVVLDVGANIGTFSLLAASRGGRVLAFEPNPTAGRRLEENVRLNGMTEVRLRAVAVGARSGRARFTTGLDLMNHMVQDANGDSVEVALTTLDREAEGVGHVALVKLEAEGYEREILDGASTLLTQSAPPAWLVEVNGQRNRARGGDAPIREVFARHGYRPYEYRADVNRLLACEGELRDDRWNLIFLREPAPVRERLERR